MLTKDGEEAFEHYSSAILRLPDDPKREDVFDFSRFGVYEQPDEDLRITYAPFDWIEDTAKVVIVGLTPGPSQVRIAMKTAREGLLHGDDAATILRSAKRSAAFGGPMRSNLVGMLDEIGLADALAIGSCADLWEHEADLLHSTSIVRWPAFVSGEPYNGHKPPMAESGILRPYGIRLAEELAAIPSALVLPLGRGIKSVLGLFNDPPRSWGNVPALKSERVLAGLPHPSGSNGHRKRQFEERRSELRTAVEHWATANW